MEESRQRACGAGKVFTQIANALAADARRDLAKARLADLDRQHGTQAIGVDLYAAKDRKAPVSDGELYGRQYFGGRWCVTLVRWDSTGQGWKRVRKLSGPLVYEAALAAAGQIAAKRNLPRV